MDTQVLNILEGARNEILTNGWCKGTSERGKQCCILFAMEKHTPGGYNKYTQEAEEITKTVLQVDESITHWNDARVRTKKDVIQALDCAISAVKSKI